MKERELTARESAILEAYATQPASKVAREFEILEQSVREALKRAYFKLGVSSKEDAVKVARERGYLPYLD